MVSKAEKLAQLRRLAQLKSDIELKRLSAFSNNLAATRLRIDECDNTIAQCYASVAPMSLSDGRVASAQAGEAARDAARAREDLERMLPRFELARQRAAKEFGRAEVLRVLAKRKQKGTRA